MSTHCDLTHVAEIDPKTSATKEDDAIGAKEICDV